MASRGSSCDSQGSQSQGRGCICLSVYLSICLSVCLSACLSLFLSLSLCLSVCLSLYLSLTHPHPHPLCISLLHSCMGVACGVLSQLAFCNKETSVVMCLLCGELASVPSGARSQRCRALTALFLPESTVKACSDASPMVIERRMVDSRVSQLQGRCYIWLSVSVSVCLSLILAHSFTVYLALAVSQGGGVWRALAAGLLQQGHLRCYTCTAFLHPPTIPASLHPHPDPQPPPTTPAGGVPRS